jgi:hypothetical protein
MNPTMAELLSRAHTQEMQRTAQRIRLARQLSPYRRRLTIGRRS